MLLLALHPFPSQLYNVPLIGTVFDFVCLSIYLVIVLECTSNWYGTCLSIGTVSAVNWYRAS